MHYYGSYFSARLKRLLNGWDLETLLHIGTYFGSSSFVLKSIHERTKLFVSNRNDFFWTTSDLEHGFECTKLILKYDISCFLDDMTYQGLWKQFTPCISQYLHTVRRTVKVQSLKYPYFKIFLSRKLNHWANNRITDKVLDGFSISMNYFHMCCWWITANFVEVTENEKTQLLRLFKWKNFSTPNLHYILSHFDLPSDICTDIYKALDKQCTCICCQRMKCCSACLHYLEDCVNFNDTSIRQCDHHFPTNSVRWVDMDIYGNLDCNCWNYDTNCVYGMYLWDGYGTYAYGMKSLGILNGVMTESFSDIQNRTYKHSNIYHLLGAVGLYIYHIRLIFPLNNDPQVRLFKVIESWLTMRAIIYDFPWTKRDQIRNFHETYPFIPLPSDID